MKNKIYLFDVDGVIVNSEYFTIKYSEKYGTELSKFDYFFNNEFLECLVGRKDLKEEIKPWLKNWNWSKSVDEFLENWFELENKINTELINQIERLKKEGHKLFLATNQEKYRVEYLNNNMGLKKYFEKTYFSGLIGHTKPSKDFYNYIIQDLDTNPENIYFFDDNKENVLSARKLGIYAIQYKIGDNILL